MDKKDSILSLFSRNRETLIKLGVISIGIFGSVARGEDDQDSDYDILVELRKDCRKFYNFNKICDFLENNIGDNFDLITMDGLSPHIGEKILKEVEYADITS